MNTKKYLEIIGIFLVLFIVHLISRWVIIKFNLGLYYNIIDSIAFFIGFLIIFIYKKIKKPDFSNLKENLGKESIFLPKYPIDRKEIYDKFYDKWINTSLVITLIIIILLLIYIGVKNSDISKTQKYIFELIYVIISIFIWIRCASKAEK